MTNMIKIIDAAGDFTLSAIDGTALATEIVKRHAKRPIISTVQTRLAMATALLKAAEKDEKTRLTVSLSGTAVVTKMVAYAAQDALKCYCDDDSCKTANDYGQLFGQGGRLTIIKEYASGVRSTGQAELVSGDIASDLTHYYIHSEQQASIFMMSEARAGEQTHYGAAMLSLLPAAQAEGVAAIYDKLATFADLADLLAAGLTIEQAAQQLLSGIDYKVVLREAVRYRCDCSRQKMTSALLSIGPAELAALRDQDGAAELNCHFCGQTYHFSAADLDKLIEELL